MFRLSASELNKIQAVKNFDRELYLKLRNIWQIKNFLQNNTEKNCTLKQQLLEEESVLTAHFTKESLKKTPLLWITILGSYHNSAEFLILAGADVNELCHSEVRYNQLNINGNLSILHALLQMDPSSENEKIIRLAVHHGANLQTRDSNGRTALHQAIASGRVEMTELLLRKGADVNVVDNEGNTPALEAASIYDAGELLPVLMRFGADISVKDADGENILHRLSRAPLEHIQIASALIERGVSLDDREQKANFQPIHVAAARGKSDLINMYLHLGADVNSLAIDDISPLYLAIKNRQFAAAETLVKRGARVDQKRAENGRTALHEACANMDEENIRLLLSYGAYVIAKDNEGKTPFALFDPYYYNGKRVGTWLMIKALAFQITRHPEIEIDDELILEWYPRLWNYYQDCVDELHRMSMARITRSCTLLDLVLNCHCEIAEQLRDPQFENNFSNHDLTEFTVYADDAVRNFERTQIHFYIDLLETESMIREACYDSLPSNFIRKTAANVCACSEHV